MRRRSFLKEVGLFTVFGTGSRFVGLSAHAASRNRFRIVLLGDCLFTRGMERGDPGVQALLPILRGADVTIGNFEGTLADANTWAAAVECGGMNIRGDETVADDLKWMGIDMVGTANNHAWDWGPDGIRATSRKLSQAGIQNTGAGNDLREARKAAYYDAPGGRTSLISCTSTFASGTHASNGNTSVPGRPGVNPLRIQTSGSGREAKALMNQHDVLALTNSVRHASRTADFVIVSCHTHQGDGGRLIPPAFLEQFAKSCIDAGADAFFSHGPHVLRGIELYKRKPIFYSLGAFIFRARETRSLPEEMYENCEPTEHSTANYFEGLYQSWASDTEFWESIIAQVDFENGNVIGVSLLPTVIKHRDPELFGLPALADAERSRSILRRLQQMSEPFDVVVEISGNSGHLKL